MQQFRMQINPSKKRKQLGVEDVPCYMNPSNSIHDGDASNISSSSTSTTAFFNKAKRQRKAIEKQHVNISSHNTTTNNNNDDDNASNVNINLAMSSIQNQNVAFDGLSYPRNDQQVRRSNSNGSASGYHDATNNYGNTNGVEIQNRYQTRINAFPYDVKSYLDPNFYAKHMQQQSMMRSPRNQASPISSTTATVGSVIPQQQHF